MSSNFNSFHSFGPLRVRAPLTLDEDSFSSSSEIEFSYGKPGKIRTGMSLAIPSDCDTVEESEVSEAESDSRFICRDDWGISRSLTSPFLEVEKGGIRENLPMFRPIAQLSFEDETLESLVSEEEVEHEFDYRLLSMTPPRVKILEYDDDEGADHESLGHGNSSIADWDSLSEKEIDCVELDRDSIASPLEFVKRVVAENELEEIQEDKNESKAVSGVEEQLGESMEHQEESMETIPDFDIDEHLEEPESSVVLQVVKGSEEQTNDVTHAKIEDEMTFEEDDRDDWNSCIVLGETRVIRRHEEEEILSVFPTVKGIKITVYDTPGLGAVDAPTRAIMLYLGIIDSMARDSDDLSLMKLLGHFFPYELGVCEQRYGIRREIMGAWEGDTWEYRNGENWRTENLVYEGELVKGCVEDGWRGANGKGVSMGKKVAATWQTSVALGLGCGTAMSVVMNHTCRGVIGVKTTNSWLHLSLVTFAPFISSVCKNLLSL